MMDAPEGMVKGEWKAGRESPGGLLEGRNQQQFCHELPVITRTEPIYNSR